MHGSECVTYYIAISTQLGTDLCVIRNAGSLILYSCLWELIPMGTVIFPFPGKLSPSHYDVDLIFVPFR